jgi:hypothetical protein
LDHSGNTSATLLGCDHVIWVNYQGQFSGSKDPFHVPIYISITAETHSSAIEIYSNHVKVSFLLVYLYLHFFCEKKQPQLPVLPVVHNFETLASQLGAKDFNHRKGNLSHKNGGIIWI